MPGEASLLLAMLTFDEKTTPGKLNTIDLPTFFMVAARPLANFPRQYPSAVTDTPALPPLSCPAISGSRWETPSPVRTSPSFASHWALLTTTVSSARRQLVSRLLPRIPPSFPMTIPSAVFAKNPSLSCVNFLPHYGAASCKMMVLRWL
jgi:hypothetical protein